MDVSADRIFEKVGCGIVTFDSEGRFTFINTNAERMLGRPRSSLLGRPWPERGCRILSPEGSPLGTDDHPFSRVMRGEPILAEEFILERPDKTRIAIAVNAGPFRDSSGQIHGAVADFTNITEKKEEEAKIRQTRKILEQNERRLQALVGSIDEIVFELDVEGRYINIWTDDENLLKRPREELIDRKVREVLGAESGEVLEKILQRVLETGQAESLEYPLEVLGGRRWFLARVSPIPSPEGKPRTVAFLARDITDRKGMEERLRESEARFRALLENVQLAATILETSGRILFCNDFFLRLTGWTREEVIGKNWFDTFVPADKEEEVRAFWREKSFTKGTCACYHEHELLTRSGDRRLMGWNSILLRNSHGKTLCCASIAEDITERRRAEEMLRQSDRMKTEFISMAAHELRTPLTAVMGYAELLLRPDQFGVFTPDQQQQFLEEIYEKSSTLTRIVNDLLDLSRLESGQPLPLELTPCSLEDILHRMVRNYQVHFPKIRFELDLASDCPKSLLIDRSKMEQVLENLLSNAVKYSPRETRIRVRGGVSGENYAISVEDEGIGMTPDQVSRIFDKFYRVDTSDTAVSGLGLGMNIVQSIIRAHGGAIRVASTPGKGTSVTFILPLPRT